MSEIKNLNNDNIYRPKSFKYFYGQSDLVNNIKIYISSAKKRNDILDHCLFQGPSGLGKTTLAYLVSKEFNSNLTITTAPNLQKLTDITSILINLNQNDILFIDEIHRLNANIEEYLYSAMEDFIIDLNLDSGSSSKSVSLKLNKFTLIGATTKSGLLSQPLLNRFGINMLFNFYNNDTLKLIIQNNANNINFKVTPEALDLLANSSRGTPRIAINILKRARDFAIEHNSNIININVLNETLSALKILRNGLHYMDLNILKIIHESFKGGPVGLSTLASALGESKETIETVYEPYLLLNGYISIKKGGRVLLDKAYSVLNIKNLF